MILNSNFVFLARGKSMVLGYMIRTKTGSKNLRKLRKQFHCSYCYFGKWDRKRDYNLGRIRRRTSKFSDCRNGISPPFENEDTGLGASLKTTALGKGKLMTKPGTR